MATAALRLVEGSSMDKSKALDAALSQIERNFGKGSIMRLGKNNKSMDVDTVSTGSLGLDIALGIGGLPRGRVVEIYGPEILRQDHAGAALPGGGAEEGRHLRLHRCRARARPDLCPQARRQCRRPADLAARCRRAGARNRRYAGALGRGRRAGDRFGRGARSARRARRRDGRQPARPAGAADEPGAAQAHRLDQPVQHHGDLHQPDPHEDRRDVRLARRPPPAATRSNSTPRCASTSAASARSRSATRWSATRPASRWSRTSSRRRSSRSSSTSCMARACRRSASSSTSASRPAWWRSPAPGSPTTASASARAARTPRLPQAESRHRRQDRGRGPAECRPHRREDPGRRGERERRRGGGVSAPPAFLG